MLILYYVCLSITDADSSNIYTVFFRPLTKAPVLKKISISL
jgi:hypothetical protein